MGWHVLARGGAGYISSKADDARTWDVDHALNEVWEVVSEWGDPDYEDWSPERTRQTMEGLRHAEDESDFTERSMGGGIDEPWEYNFGCIVKTDVPMAIAAVRRAVEILDQESEDE